MLRGCSSRILLGSLHFIQARKRGVLPLNVTLTVVISKNSFRFALDLQLESDIKMLLSNTPAENIH